MGDWLVTEEPALRGYGIEWVEPGLFLLSRREILYASSDLRPPFRRLGAFPAPAWRRELARLRPAQRALRFTYHNVLRRPDGSYFLSFARSLGLLSASGFAPMAGLVRPCRVLRGGCALAEDGSVFFGEYIANRERDTAIHLYRCPAGSREAQVARRFPPGWTRHIHGVFRDPLDGALWLCCGDVGEECRIIRSRDGFATFETIGQGDESWRAVSLLFTPEALWYATDAEFEQNRIFRVDRESGEREVVGEVDGPVYYSHAVGRDLFFAVSAELCPSQQGRNASLWWVDASGRCRRIASFPKDRLHVRYFQPGVLGFARGPGLEAEFLFTGAALRGADGRTFRVRRDPAAQAVPVASG